MRANSSMQMLAGLAAFVAVALQSAFAQTTPVERPALKPGSEWNYRIDNSKRDKPGPPGELKRTIKEAGAAEYTIELSTGTGAPRTGAMSLDLNPFNEDMSFASRATGPIPYFSFPLAPGKTYEGKLTYPSPFGSSGIDMTTTSKVLDWEEVTVPAGKFRALKIEVNSRSNGAGGKINGTRKVVLWYAPEVGS